MLNILVIPYFNNLFSNKWKLFRDQCKFFFSVAECRHDTLIQSKRKQQIAIFLQLHVTIRVTSAIFFIRSRHFLSMKLRDCSKIPVFLKLAHLLLHSNAISTRAFTLQKSAGKKMVLFAILMHSFGQP